MQRTARIVLCVILLFLLFLCIVALAFLLIFHRTKPIPEPLIPTTTTPPMTSKVAIYEINVWVFTKDDSLRTLKLRVSEDAKIKSVKEEVESMEGIPVKHQSLSSLGEPLDDEQTFKFYNIRKGSIIDDITNY